MSRAENRKYHVIYKITCLVNNKFYVGCHSTDDLEDGYFGSGKRIRYSVQKHGKDNHTFEILEFCESRKSMFEREETLVNVDLLKEELCLNIVRGGRGDFPVGAQKKGSSKGGQAYAKKLKDDPEYKKQRSAQISATLTKMYKDGILVGKPNKGYLGRTHSEETKKKIQGSSIGSHVGEKNSQFGTCWICNHETSMKIKKEDLDIHLNQGWSTGRKIKMLKL